LAAVCLCEVEIDLSFVSDANLSDADAEFAFRYQKSEVLDVPDAIHNLAPSAFPSKIFSWLSTSVEVKSVTDISSNANILLGFAIPPSKYVIPFSFIAYASGATAVKSSFDDFIDAVKAGKIIASFKGGFVGMAALSIEEYDTNGEPVPNTRVPLMGECNPQKIVKNGVTAMACEMDVKNARNEEIKVIVSFLTSEDAGRVKYGYSPVSPRSIEMLVEVQNFNLHDRSRKNHARMDFAFVSASGTGTIDGNAKYIKQDGEKVYVAASGNAICDEDTADVGVTIEVGNIPDDLGLTSFDKLADITVGANYTIHIAHIDFPSGKRDFVYDPAAGAGAIVYDSAATAALSLLAALVCALLLLL